MRVRKVVESLPTQSDFELFTEEEERVSFEDEMTEKFEVFTDDNFPGQFRVVGDKIEKVTTIFSIFILFYERTHFLLLFEFMFMNILCSICLKSNFRFSV